MTAEKKLAALVKVANTLNNNKVVWAVGGSFLLYVKQIVDDFNDIDIMVLESDVEKVKALLKDYGILRPQNSDSQYTSKVFLEYIIDDVDFDIIAGFTIVTGTTDNYFPLMEDGITDSIIIDKISIPLHSLSEWKTYYSLMGKFKKVELIEKHLT